MPRPKTDAARLARIALIGLAVGVGAILGSMAYGILVIPGTLYGAIIAALVIMAIQFFFPCAEEKSADTAGEKPEDETRPPGV